jgi:hypothetical protein
VGGVDAWTGLSAGESTGSTSVAGPTKTWCTQRPSSRWSAFIPSRAGTNEPFMASFSSAHLSLPSAAAGKRTATSNGAELAMGTLASAAPTARVRTGGFAKAL